MSELIRDTVLGHFLRLVTGKRVLLYEEEKHPELWEKYVNREKTSNMAVHGQPQPPESQTKPDSDHESERKHKEEGTTAQRDPSPSGSQSSESTIIQDDLRLGNRVDPEKGRDSLVVDWWGPDDPEVCIAILNAHLLLNIYRTHETGVVQRDSGSLSSSACLRSRFTLAVQSTAQVSWML